LRNCGFIYRKVQNKKLLFYVLQSMECNVIRTCHGDIDIGIDKIIGNITKVYWFSNMQEKEGIYCQDHRVESYLLEIQDHQSKH